MKKPSKEFVKEMEKMYPKGAVITPTKKSPIKAKMTGKAMPAKGKK